MRFVPTKTPEQQSGLMRVEELLRVVAEFIQARCHPEGSLAARKHTCERNHGVTCRSEMPDLGIISEILSYDVCQLPDSDAAWYANLFMHKQGIRYSRDVMEAGNAIWRVAVIITF